MKMKLQSNLESILKIKKMSIREFARRVDYRLDTVRQLHNNTIKRIPVELIERACAELHCSVGELIYVCEDEMSERPTGM